MMYFAKNPSLFFSPPVPFLLSHWLPSQPLVTLKEKNPLSLVSVAHACMDDGHQQEHLYPLRGYILEES